MRENAIAMHGVGIRGGVISVAEKGWPRSGWPDLTPLQVISVCKYELEGVRQKKNRCARHTRIARLEKKLF